MKYMDAYGQLVKTAGKWDNGVRALISSDLWKALRSKFPKLPDDPLKSLRYKSVLPIRSELAGLQDSLPEFRDKNKLLTYNANGWQTIKGAIRDQFGAGDYRIRPGVGFDYRDKSGKVFTINLNDVPLYRNGRKITDKNGQPLYDALIAGNYEGKVNPFAAMPVMTGDPDWWKKRIAWRSGADGVQPHQSQVKTPEELFMANARRKKFIPVRNGTTSFMGRTVTPDTSGSSHWANTRGPELLMYRPTAEPTVDEFGNMVKAYPTDDGFFPVPQGIQGNPFSGYRTDNLVKGSPAVPGITYEELEGLADGKRLSPSTLMHEIIHSVQEPDARWSNRRIGRNSDVSAMGIDWYAYQPNEVLQAGLSYKAAIQAAKQLPEEELVRIFGDQAARVRKLSPFAKGDRKVYRDLEYLRQHPAVAMQLGEEVTREVSRYAHFKQLAYDIKRRQGLYKKLSGDTKGAIRAVRSDMFDAYNDMQDGASMPKTSPYYNVTPSQLELLDRILDHRDIELHNASVNLANQSNAIKNYRDWFMDLHKRASKH